MTALALLAVILIGTVFMSFTAKVNAGEEKKVRVGWYESTYCHLDQLGRRSGLAYDYQQKIAAYTGWTYEYVDGTWPELLQMLRNGEIDMLSDVSYTKERAEDILYSRIPMTSETYYIFIKAGNDKMSLEDINTFNGKVFAADKDSMQAEYIKKWADNVGIKIDLLELMDSSVDESFEMLKKGEIDAYVTVESYGNREGCMPVCSVGSSESFFAVTRGRTDLIKELNSAMAKIQNENPYYNQKLLQKYIWSAKTNTYLTAKEIAWLSGHGKIRVGYRNNYMPFSTDERGVLAGALGDFLALVPDNVKDTGIEFETVPYATAQGCLSALQNGEIDVAAPIFLSPSDAENMGLLSTESLMETEIFAVVKPGNPKDIFTDENVKAAILSGSVNFEVFVKDNYPDWEIVFEPSLEECYKAVYMGDADCTFVNSYRITLVDRLRRRYKLSLLATGQNMEFAFAVKKGNSELYSIMNKLVVLTDSSETATNLSRYASSTDKVTFEDYLQDNAASFLAVAAVILFIMLLLTVAKVRSDRKALDRQKLIDATELDPLTKLYTRNYFFEYANRMHNENPDYKLDAIALNIEQFHVVNAIYGWDFGDKVLLALGEEVKAYVGENDGIACRSTADRFYIYCLHTDDYKGIYERLQRAVDVFSENVSIRIRMGVMPYQPDLGPIELFDRARTASSMVRGGHHDRMMVFNEEMRKREILEQKLTNDLKYALEQHEFVVFYQPKYNVQADPPILQSAEALVRWNHHDLGMIPPGTFINLFERNGQIGQIDKYVWNEAARQIGEWKEKYGISIPVSVNLSRMDMFEPELIKNIDEIIERNGISRAALHLEVTESAYTDDAEQIIGVVGDLRSRGYIIEMDDFGTGYSSLNMLSRMPVDILKLDKSFIDKIEKPEERKEKDIRMIELILDIAKSLKLMVVAEGVENGDQLEFLKGHGCEMVQGYYFSKPVPAEDFEKLAFGENRYKL
ncbi:EAL domain-containing protein [Butyrivibrio sp. VCB2001]|uniref:EAL domain-containing protein n=1 Tax=Butyrivibrio sp. VCB2001 TaxID=1280667 RepID=UPI0004296ED7|nr:EAL domain-containing protein [Butyrivibrio sp. VCB2001]